MKKLNQIN